MGAVLPTPALGLVDLAGLPIESLNDEVFTLEAEGFKYPVRLKLEPGADRLFIMLHGAIERSSKPLPAFARWNWGKILKGHVLAVCDPTLYQSYMMELGWYVGNSEAHAIPGLVAISEQIRAQLGVAPGRMIYYGSSGGGYAAILAACHTGRHGRAIAVNPQIELFEYHAKHLKALARALGTRQKHYDLATLPLIRTSAIAAYSDARGRGQAPGIVIAQNTTDEFHHENHYQKFVESVGLSPEGAYDASRHLGAIVFTAPGGHKAAESKDLVNRLSTEAIPFLLDKPTKKPWWRW